MQRNLEVELKDLVNKTENLIKQNIMSLDMVRKLQGFKYDLICHGIRGLSSDVMDDLIDVYYDFKLKRS